MGKKTGRFCGWLAEKFGRLVRCCVCCGSRTTANDDDDVKPDVSLPESNSNLNQQDTSFDSMRDEPEDIDKLVDECNCLIAAIEKLEKGDAEDQE